MLIVRSLPRSTSLSIISHNGRRLDTPRMLEAGSKNKTYNSGNSLVVTQLGTNPPVEGLTCGERTGSGVLLRQWSYVEEMPNFIRYQPGLIKHFAWTMQSLDKKDNIKSPERLRLRSIDLTNIAMLSQSWWLTPRFLVRSYDCYSIGCDFAKWVQWNKGSIRCKVILFISMEENNAIRHRAHVTVKRKH